MRSLLFVPAHREDLIEKALKSEADILIFDLEDSCPEKFHEQGMLNIMKYECKKNLVRVRNYYDRHDLEDFCDNFIMPKYESPVIQIRPFGLIETATGVLNSGNLAHYCEGLIFGNEDYLADTGCSDYSFARGMIVNAARSAGVLAIDTVFVDIKNPAAFVEECIKVSRMGFDGKLCLNPEQAGIVNQIFTPSNDRYEYAKKVLECTKQIDVLDGQLIGPPMIKRAKKIISKYELYTK